VGSGDERQLAVAPRVEAKGAKTQDEIDHEAALHRADAILEADQLTDRSALLDDDRPGRDPE
jgi:hypothetical protein